MTDRSKYRLTVDVVAPGFRDQIQIEDVDLDALEPKYILDRDGREWIRYGTDDDYVEVRREHVVMRTLTKIEPESTPEAPKVDELRSERIEPPPRNTPRFRSDTGDPE